nr:alcohol dehydrogenase 1-like [Leptinotarsa decemlineata]
MNDAIWEKEIDINLKGEVTGVLLGLENYLKNHKQGREAVILNTSSIAGLFGQPLVPVYAATKFGVVGLTKCWGTPFHYERSSVRVVAVCPGITDTTIFQDKNSLILPEYEQGWPVPVDQIGSTQGQKLDHLSKEIVRIIKLAGNGSIYVVENGEPAYEFILPGREAFKGNLLKDGN